MVEKGHAFALSNLRFHLHKFTACMSTRCPIPTRAPSIGAGPSVGDSCGRAGRRWEQGGSWVQVLAPTRIPRSPDSHLRGLALEVRSLAPKGWSPALKARGPDAKAPKAPSKQHKLTPGGTGLGVAVFRKARRGNLEAQSFFRTGLRGFGGSGSEGVQRRGGRGGGKPPPFRGF